MILQNLIWRGVVFQTIRYYTPSFWICKIFKFLVPTLVLMIVIVLCNIMCTKIQKAINQFKQAYQNRCYFNNRESGCKICQKILSKKSFKRSGLKICQKILQKIFKNMWKNSVKKSVQKIFQKWYGIRFYLILESWWVKSMLKTIQG